MARARCGHRRTFIPSTKNVARASPSASMNRSVVSGSGPSSNVSATSGSSVSTRKSNSPGRRFLTKDTEANRTPQ